MNTYNNLHLGNNPIDIQSSFLTHLAYIHIVQKSLQKKNPLMYLTNISHYIELRYKLYPQLSHNV